MNGRGRPAAVAVAAVALAAVALAACKPRRHRTGELPPPPPPSDLDRALAMRDQVVQQPAWWPPGTVFLGAPSSYDLVADAGAVLIGATHEGVIVRIPKDGSQAHTIARLDLQPRALAVAADRVYVVAFHQNPDLPTGIVGDGTLSTVAVAGGPVRAIAQAVPSRARIAAAPGGGVYLAGAGVVSFTPPALAARAVLPEVAAGTDAFAADDHGAVLVRDDVGAPRAATTISVGKPGDAAPRALVSADLSSWPLAIDEHAAYLFGAATDRATAPGGGDYARSRGRAALPVRHRGRAQARLRQERARPRRPDRGRLAGGGRDRAVAAELPGRRRRPRLRHRARGGRGRPGAGPAPSGRRAERSPRRAAAAPSSSRAERLPRGRAHAGRR